MMIWAACTVMAAMAVTPVTVEFSSFDGDRLKMDVYLPENQNANPREALIFAFGGGFTHGQRDEPRYRDFFQFLADNGIVAISTDYRTVLPEEIKKYGPTPVGFAQAMAAAIETAVGDFYSATAHVLANAEEWNVDPGRIVACGSSAGAITALQAEYQLVNGLVPEGTFPPGFNYAGVVSFAGAVLSGQTLTWSESPCPMMLFHGSADRNVPFGAITEGSLGFYGSQPLSESLGAMKTPCEFYSFEGSDHSVATSPMHENLYDILGFLKRIEAGKENLSRNVTEMKPGARPAPAPGFTIEDYIKANS